MLAALLVLTAFGLCVPATAFGAANAIITPAGYNANLVPRGDDTNNLIVNLPFNMNWMGTQYNQVYINMNGNVTFVDPYCDSTVQATYQAHNLYTTQYYNTPNPYLPIIAPFFADVDTTNIGGGQASFSATTGVVPQFQGHNCFIVNWIGVMPYVSNTHPTSTYTDSFQLLLVDRSDTGAGNFDIVFNYDTITWDVGSTGGSGAVAGWSTAAGASGWYQLPGSLSAAGTSQFLDTSASSTSLIQNSLNSGGVLGRYIWQVRNGAPPNSPPKIVAPTHTFEGNMPGGYVGYTGSDVSVTDPDGVLMSWWNNLPLSLPLGVNSVTWTGSDDESATTSVVQTLTVVDTTPPSNPTLSSTFPLSTWASNSSIPIRGVGVTDACSGLTGFSDVWSQNATALPDPVVDSLATSTATNSVTTTVTSTTTSTIDYQSFPTSTWPAAWTRSDTAYVALSGVQGHYYDTYAAEVWANNTTRRTVNFYRDYVLTGYTAAQLSFWNAVTGFAGGTDYSRVEYSTDGGTTWTQLQNLTAATVGQRYTFSLPAGGTVRVRFSASLNSTTEFADWDAIQVVASKQVQSPVSYNSVTTSMATTSTLADGVWYFNIRSVDAAGNWSGPTSIGPFDIDTVKPSTTCSAPSVWTSATVSATLSATDPSGPIAATWYKLDSGAVTTYTASIPVTTEGTHTLLYWSADKAGNVEATNTAQIRIDLTKPSTPASISASAASTTSIGVSWSASTDAVSGVGYYSVFRNGSLVGTTTALTYIDTGLSQGATYTYYVIAYDKAGNAATQTVTASATTPTAELWMSLSTNIVSMGGVTPGLASTVTSATTVKVGGIGGLTYDFWCSAVDFKNSNSGSITPTMPVSALSYQMSGYASVPLQTFSATNYLLDTAVGTNYVWEHDYRFDYVLNVPWAFDPGTYTTTVMYTVVSR